MGVPTRPALLALALLSGTTALPGCATSSRLGSRPPTTTTATTATAGSVEGFRSVRTYEEVAEPVRIRVPRISVDAGFERLGRARDGTIEVPRAWASAGWYGDGPRPGQPGPAVILGHVDSVSGPAVFYRLVELRSGDELLVDRADGSTARFLVSSVARYPKTRFPTDAVYYPTLQPELRLVTCGGSFDAAAGHYLDNVVVFASLAA